MTSRTARFEPSDPRSPWYGIDVEACYNYTLSRQTSDGGFCFYAYHEWGVEESNAADTYPALAILRLLGRSVPDAGACAAWLKAQQDEAGGYPTLVIGYAALKALQLLGARPLRDPRRFLQDTAAGLGLNGSPGDALTGWLLSALRCIELWQDFGITVTDRIRQRISATLHRLEGKDGGYGAPAPNLPETAYAVALATALDLPLKRDVLTYVRQCEGRPHGFNITPAAVSSGLESQYAGVKVLRRFGEAPKYPELTRAYVASCQTAVGGFGRTPVAIATLDHSRLALETLSILASADDIADV